MVVHTEILLQAWRERWTPLQWLVEVKKLAGKNKGDLQDLAGDCLEKKCIWNLLLAQTRDVD